MNTKDYLDHTLSGATAQSVDHFETACHQLRCYVGDPVGAAQAALHASPEMTMAPRADGLPEPAGHRAGRRCRRRARRCDAARALPADEREAHAPARPSAHLVDGRWHAAGLVLEDLSIRYPRDLLALQAGHQIDFFTRRCAHAARPHRARRRRTGTPGMPGYHAVLGMHAFGLEETGDYARAEALGRRAVELRAARRLGLARGGARDGDAGPAPRRRRLARASTATPGATAASSRSTTGGTWRCSTSTSTQIDEALALVDSRSARHRPRRWCWT